MSIRIEHTVIHEIVIEEMRLNVNEIPDLIRRLQGIAFDHDVELPAPPEEDYETPSEATLGAMFYEQYTDRFGMTSDYQDDKNRWIDEGRPHINIFLDILRAEVETSLEGWPADRTKFHTGISDEDQH